MAHTYATVADANNYLMSSGATVFAAEAAAQVAVKLATLEAVSRRIDYVCHRSAFGSGFGPRLGTNKYDGDGSDTLHLRDDLLSVTTVTSYPITGSTTSSTPVSDTDFYLTNFDGYTGPPWRKVVLHGRGTPLYFGAGLRVTTILGTWGYSNVTAASTTTVASGLASGTTATTFTTSATPTISPGMTLLIGSEQLYVSGLSSTTATVVRGVNGTTAATHANSSAIAVYTYPGGVNEVALRLFTRRWKARDAGADGTDGGGDMPGVIAREGEDTIIRRGLSDLMLLGTY